MTYQTNNENLPEEDKLDQYLGVVRRSQEKRKEIEKDVMFPEIEAMSGREMVTEVKRIGADRWLALSKWTADYKYFEPQDRQLFYRIGVWVGKGNNVSHENAKFCLICYNKAINAGFNKTIEDL